ncbi:MAG TPA: BBP7 family outer membrane beta-barrel protein [Candidatus Methylacidiphilales bacterium]|nr:BBP7 family outer membrane beta-barrel protein [Candidatus Methylacidiphilales bacterium]
MKSYNTNRWLFVLGVLPVAFGFYSARVLAAPADDLSPTIAMEMKTNTFIRSDTTELPREPRYWITPEYVHYWQNTTTRLPQLLSIANGADTAPLANFYGNQGITWDDGNGVKLTAGTWIDNEERYGIELCGLYIPDQHQSVAFNPLPGDVDAFFTDNHLGHAPFISENGFPGDPASNTSFQYSTEQYGGELNGLAHFVDWRPEAGLRIEESALLGFRYFGLKDNFSSAYNEPTFGFFYNDYFKTINNFYGANLGGHVRVEYQRFFTEITPKIALGVTDEEVDISGSNTVAFVPGPNGFYASGNKVGNHSLSNFACLPEITVKAGYDFNDTVEAFVGYDALYLSAVARVENQISTQLDGQQMAGFSYVPGGPADGSPPFKVMTSSLFEQGVTTGITLKF